jgi:hypothetical protein
MDRLKIGSWYRIQCRRTDWGSTAYGEWKYLYISGDYFTFEDENGARLNIPRQPRVFAPKEPWILEQLEYAQD